MAATEIGNLAFIETTMDRRQYLNILKQNLGPSVRKLQLGNRCTVQQDKHAAYYCTNTRMDPIQRNN